MCCDGRNISPTVVSAAIVEAAVNRPCPCRRVLCCLTSRLLHLFGRVCASAMMVVHGCHPQSEATASFVLESWIVSM